MEITYKDCWAKTDKDGRPALGVWEHCLNVGAVAAVLFDRLPAPLRPFAIRGLVTLAAAHDIGKIAAGFQAKCAHYLASLHLSPLEARAWQEAAGNHAEISQAILGQFAFPGDKELAKWTIAAGGHHGFFPHPSRARPRVALDHPLPDFVAAREELLRELIAHFGPLPTEPRLHDDHLLWVTGFITLADWLGSNEELYPLAQLPVDWRADPDISTGAATARAAIDALCIGSGKPVPGHAFGDLFQTNDGQPFDLRPLQFALLQAATAPGLYIVEAPMGEGKTEAALAAAYQLWDRGHHHGLYFGLPTQLTSERIHDRLQPFLDRAITSDGARLTLVHGHAWLKDDLRILDVAPTLRSPDDFERIDARRWFTSSRRPLLAPFGVGTIDQALMATMSVKHAGLRLFALGGKVVVLDEVHSFDPYTGRLIDALVKRLLNLNCSVIVLSATLSTARRRELLEHGAGRTETNQSDAYPLLTVAHHGDTETQAIPFDPDPKLERRVGIDICPPDSEVPLAAAVEAAEAGAAVLIVRNTVALAQQTYDQLKSACRTGVDTGLLHSRFTPEHRGAIETEWLARFGKGATTRGRCILVATQIVEQSVDIDADLLISDLAPSDLLIQRLGRLHRHRDNDPTRPARVRQARLILLDPLTGTEPDARAIKDALAPHHFIYPPYALLRSSARWRDLGGAIALPADIRQVIESTHAPLSDQPAAWAELQAQQDDQIQKKINTAQVRSNPLARIPPIDDSENNINFGTRWAGQSSALIVLCKSQPAGDGRRITFLDGDSHEVEFFCWSIDLAKALHRNAVKVPRWQIAEALPDAPDWLTQHISDAVIGIVGDGGEIEFQSTADLPGILKYDARHGARFWRIQKPSSTSADDEEDGWN